MSNVVFWAIWITLMTLVVAVCYALYGLRQMQNQITSIQKRIQSMIKGRETFYASLTDSDAILADMERGAVAMEALVARRHRNIRDDAGPHAKVYKPRKFGRLPKTQQ